MTKEELIKDAEKFLTNKSRSHGRVQSLCDVINRNGTEPKEMFYSEPKLIDFLSEFAEPREKRIKDLEKENAELKTIKIPQLERRIASIRGAHSVDCKKLNARTEQVERLKQEIAELKNQVSFLKDNLRVARKDRENLQLDVAKGLKEFVKDYPATSLRFLANEKYIERLTKAKEIITNLVKFNGDYKDDEEYQNKSELYDKIWEEAEQFLNSEVSE